MVTNIYVDGSGGTKSGYGFFIKETGESFFEGKPGITLKQELNTNLYDHQSI